MAEAVFQCFFPGHSTTFRQNRQPFSGKSGDPAGTNTAGKNALSQGRNKAERNCRHVQGAQQIKSRSCCTKKEPPHFLSGIPYGLANGGGSRFRSILCQDRAVRPTHTPQIKKKNCFQSRCGVVVSRHEPTAGFFRSDERHPKCAIPFPSAAA